MTLEQQRRALVDFEAKVAKAPAGEPAAIVYVHMDTARAYNDLIGNDSPFCIPLPDAPPFR